MDLYTLNSNFLANENVDEFVSAIWTERYSSAGDVQLVLPATDENVAKVAEGTMLALRGSKEVMILETASIDKGLLTVVGPTLVKFLNERLAWFPNPDLVVSDIPVVDYTEVTTPGEFLGSVVEQMVITPTTLGVDYEDADLDYTNEGIPGLILGDIDATGADERMTMPIGPLYDSIAQIAVKENLGISLYLESAHPIDGFVLKFKTYRGVDRTSDQVLVPLVRLSANFDTMSDIKEVRSISGYKNVVYVYYQGVVTEHIDPNWVGEPEGFDRRVLLVDAEGAPVGHAVTVNYGSGAGSVFTNYEVDAGDIAAFREQNAKDAFANNNYIKAIDGQASPNSDYTFGQDYGLGDVLELEGLTGTITKARVTEYIRTQDKSGEKQYPTISVVSE
jgi:hypothetical protein